MRASLTLAAALVAPWLAPLARADVRVVGPSPAPYAEIQAAVDVANDGDVVLVKSGLYGTVQVLDKELAIVAEANASAQVTGGIRVRNLAATRSVVLSGLTSTGTHAALATRHGLLVQNCAGSVRVVSCTLSGALLVEGFGVCQDGAGARVENSTDVAFLSTVATGSSNGGGSFQNIGDGGHGCFAQSSRLTAYDVQFRGGFPAIGYGDTMGCPPLPDPWPSSWLGAPGEGMRAEGGELFASNTLFRGVSGTNAQCDGGGGCFCQTEGANALVHDGGAAHVQLLAAGLFPGAAGINTTGTECGGLGGGGPPCSNCPTPPSGQGLVGAATQFPGSPRVLSATRIAREGGSVTLTFQGLPGDVVQLLSARSPSRILLPSSSGALLLKREHIRPVQNLGTIPSSGTLTATFTVGELGSGISSRLLHVQSLHTSTTGSTILGSAQVILLLDAGM